MFSQKPRHFGKPLLTAVLALIASSLLLAHAQTGEIQKHGFLFEQWVRDTFFGGYRPEHYTQQWDIPASANKRHGKIPANPKTAKYGGPVDLGDALRQYDIAHGSQRFWLIVGFWEQTSPAHKTFVNAQAVTVTPDRYRTLWGDITRQDLERLDAVVKDRNLSLEEARRQAQAIKRKPPFSTALITINPKIDRSQRRVQCSLRFDVFFQHLALGRSAEKDSTPQIWNVPLPSAIPSTSRTRRAPEMKP